MQIVKEQRWADNLKPRSEESLLGVGKRSQREGKLTCEEAEQSRTTIRSDRNDDVLCIRK